MSIKFKYFGEELVWKNDSSEIIFPKNFRIGETKIKNTFELGNLLFKQDNINKNEISYIYYNDVYTRNTKQIFDNHGIESGITVILSGTVNGECKKNSGHYHGLRAQDVVPVVENYEILFGEAVFLLQKSTNFKETNHKLEDLVAIFMKKGDKIIVPPYYAHCAINIGDSAMGFANMGADCPMHYEPIRKRSGFAYYILKNNERLIFINNSNYKDAPDLRIINARKELINNLDSSKSYTELFLNDPSKFDYLQDPQKMIEELEKILR